MTNSKYDDSLDVVKIARLVGLVFALIIGCVLFYKSWFTVNNHEVVALTYPNGSVEFVTQPGFYGQWFGHTQSFEKRKSYTFEETVQFNDGGYATIKGSVQYQIPLSVKALSGMYQYYPTPDSIESGLIEPNLRKAVLLTGRTMSSKESYAEKRGDLMTFMEDQMKYGPYQTHSYTKEVQDDLDTSKKKLVTAVDILTDPKAPNGLARAEPGLFDKYRIDTSNFNFTVTYEAKVEKQIEQQQSQAAQINQSIAEAKQAEQRAITAAKNGEANAATAKWDQEKINASEQARNEQLVKNAELERQAAVLQKAKLIAEGEGEATKKRLVMEADGALAQKLSTYLEVQRQWADAYKNGPSPVPQIQSGGTGGQGNGGLNFMELMGMKAAKDLSLTLDVPQGNGGTARKK